MHQRLPPSNGMVSERESRMNKKKAIAVGESSETIPWLVALQLAQPQPCGPWLIVDLLRLTSSRPYVGHHSTWRIRNNSRSVAHRQKESIGVFIRAFVSVLP